MLMQSEPKPNEPKLNEPNPNWANRTLFHHDNLAVLRGMNSETVHLIATDPPFNKGRDFHATPDSLADGASFHDRWSWEKDVHLTWIDQLEDDWPKLMRVIQGARLSYGDDMGAFLCYMAVRLIEMHRLLRQDGSLYLHCDPTASHYLKQLLDAIFGRRHFINEIVWCYTDPAGRRNTNYYKKTHDIVLWYAKDPKNYKTNRIAKSPLSPSTLKRYEKYFDEHGQITYQELKRTNPGAFRALKSVPSDLSQVWMDKNKGTTAPDWWVDITPLKRKGSKQKSESIGYPTQKPLALMERIIETTSTEGDIMLDPFAGCGTTLIAAERLGRQWVGIDIWDAALDVVLERLKKENLTPDSEESTCLWVDRIHYRKDLPERTDDQHDAVTPLKTIKRGDEPKGSRMSRAEILKELLDRHGSRCQGCDRQFDDPRYLELDHNTPRSGGGLNHISNRVLLCGPCNKLKSNQYTLSGFRRLNKKLGYMSSGA